MKELLIKLRDVVEKEEITYGLCISVSNIDANKEEIAKLSFWLEMRLPIRRFKQGNEYSNKYSFEFGKKEPRLKWLDQEIKKM